MNVTLSRIAFVAAVAASLAACGDSPPEPTEVRTGVSQSLAAIVPELESAAQSDTVGRIQLSEASRILDMVDGTPAGGAISSLQALAAEPSMNADQLTNVLNKYLFTDANHAGDGVYPVPAILLCNTGYNPDTGELTPDPDPACGDMAAKVAFKIKVRGDATNLDFTLLIGPKSREPFSLSLSKTSVEFGVDLGETNLAIKDLAATLGTDAPNFSAEGRVTLGVNVTGPQHLVVTGSITKAVKLAMAAPGVALDSAEAFRFSSAAAEVFSFDLDGAAQRLIAGLGLGETTAHVPSSVDSIDLVLGGLTGKVDVRPGAPVQLTGLGLGNRSLTIDTNGQRTLTLDVNANAGRKFDVTITETTAGASFAVSPSLDLQMSVVDTSTAPYEVTRVQLDGTTPTLTTEGDQLKVSSGHFAVTTNPAEYGVDATAGQCVQSGLTGTVSHLVVAPCAL
ncbi:MAG: hypothetical protein R3B48_30135 [Kofleriaceae bacterium]